MWKFLPSFAAVRLFFRRVLVALLILTLLPSQAALKCEEIFPASGTIGSAGTPPRYCTDSASRPASANGVTVSVPAPILPGYGAPCWLWQRTFQCIETEPVFSCLPVPPATLGTNYNTVQNLCSLTGAATRESKVVNSIPYITDATYYYACPFKDFSTTQTLPGTDCPLLTIGDEVTVASIPSAPPGSATTDPLTTILVNVQARKDEHVCYKEPVSICESVCSTSAPNPADPTGKSMIPASGPCTTPVTNCVAGAVNLKESGPSGRTIKQTENYTCRAGEIPSCQTDGNCKLYSISDAGILPNGVAEEQKQEYICSTETRSCPDENKVKVSTCVSPNAWGLDNWGSNGTKTLNGFAEANQALAQLEGIQKGFKANDPHIFSGYDKRCHFAVGGFLNTLVMLAVMAIAVAATGGLGSTLLTSQFSVTAATTMGSGVATAGVVSIGSTALTITGQQIMQAALLASAATEAETSTVFGNNCCKDLVVEGSDKWWKIGPKCTEDEVKLAISRKKNLAIYLGEYCSKESGWLFKECVERKRTYCTFDDMLALVVNEQGRQQLATMVRGDAQTTVTTPEVAFSAFTAPKTIVPGTYTGLGDGHWQQVTTANNSQVWYWQYPSYCVSSALQAQAYAAHTTQTNAALDQNGIQPGSMTDSQKEVYMRKILSVPQFQACPDQRGQIPFATCVRDDKSDACDPRFIPNIPIGASSDVAGIVSVSPENQQKVLDWQIQPVNSLKKMGDFGVSKSMSDPTFAAYSSSLNDYVGSLGSCKADGSCLYSFFITDKTANNGAGAKRTTESIVRLPLYSVIQSESLYSVNYLSQTGQFDQARYLAERPSRRGINPDALGKQRFIFYPNIPSAAAGNALHSHVLLDWAENPEGDLDNPQNDYVPLLVPSVIAGEWVHTSPSGKKFTLTGGCSENSLFCEYLVKHDLNVTQHPWGNAQDPRCWGFTIDQLAALDFSAMDLTRWINSMDMGAFTGDNVKGTQAEITKHVTDSAQTYYDSFKTGSTVNTPTAGSVALRTNSEVFPLMSSSAGESYLLKISVPSNWPDYYPDQPNTNPVTEVKVDWGDGSPLDSAVAGNTGELVASHDMGHIKAGTSVKVKVTLNAGPINGPQALSTWISITPNNGDIPVTFSVADITSDGLSGKTPKLYPPSSIGLPTGAVGSQAALDGMGLGAGADLFKTQGDSIKTAPTTP